LGQPVRQVSALACEGSVRHPIEERKKERKRQQNITHDIVAIIDILLLGCV